MNYIVLDLEWNQCPEGKAAENKSLPFEIIELGAIRLNETHQIVDRFHEVVKPQVYQSLHFKTREIVRLRAIDFTNARTFPEVAADFISWCKKGDSEPEFCTWGPTDLTELQRNLSFYRIENPFSFPLMYYDIQKIFSIVYEDRKSRKSLEYAVDYLGLPKEILFHSALSDAYYTSLIMGQLTEEQIRSNSSVDYYRLPQNREEEISLHYSTYDKFVSMLYPSRDQIMNDPVITNIRCPVCQGPVQKKIVWFPGSGHNEFALFWCPNDGYIKGKIRLRHNNDGFSYAVRTSKIISEADAYQIYEKKELLKVKRRMRRKYQKETNTQEDS